MNLWLDYVYIHRVEHMFSRLGPAHYPILLFNIRKTLSKVTFSFSLFVYVCFNLASGGKGKKKPRLIEHKLILPILQATSLQHWPFDDCILRRMLVITAFFSLTVDVRYSWSKSSRNRRSSTINSSMAEKQEKLNFVNMKGRLTPLAFKLLSVFCMFNPAYIKIYLGTYCIHQADKLVSTHTFVTISTK